MSTIVQYDEAAFKQIMDARDGAIIAKLVEKMNENRNSIIQDAARAMAVAHFGDSTTFDQAVTRILAEKQAEFEQSMPETIAKVLEADRKAQAQRVGDSDVLITRQSLEEGWTEFKNSKDEIEYERYDVPIHQFFQDIDAASGVSAARRSNLNAIFAMMAGNPFASYINMGSSNGVGRLDMGVLTGITFEDDQKTGGKKPSSASATDRAAGDVYTSSVGGLAEENVTIRRNYCNFIVSNAALEQVQGLRNAAIRAITQAFVKRVGTVIQAALAGLTLGTADTNAREVKGGTADAVPTKAQMPAAVGGLMAAPFADSVVRGSTAWVMRQELWSPLIQADLGAGFDPTDAIPVVYGYPWHASSLLPAIAANSIAGYFGNFREAIAAAIGPQMRIEINRVTHPGYTYFHAEGAIGATAHNRSNSIGTLTIKA